MSKKNTPAVSNPPTQPAANVVEIDVKKIHVDPQNPRKNIPASMISDFAESITKSGVISPVAVRPHPKKAGEYFLIYGQCRLLGSREAGKETIPAIINDVDANTAYEWMLIENLQRTGMSPVDEAESIKGLYKRYNFEEVAKRIGRSVTWVVQRIKIAEMPEEVRELLNEEKIGISHVEALAMLENRDEQISMARRGQYMSAAQLKKEVESSLRELRKAPWDLDQEYEESGLKIVPCNMCNFCSGKQAELFGDSAADNRCMDSGCWERKMKAFVSAETERLKAQKKKIVPAFKVDSFLSPYAKSKTEIAAAKAAKVKPEYVIDQTSGKVREVYKRPKETAKKVDKGQIEYKARELAFAYIESKVQNNHASQLLVAYRITTDMRCEKKIEDKPVKEMEKLHDSYLGMINDMYEDAIQNASNGDIKDLLADNSEKTWNDFIAEAKVDLGVIEEETSNGGELDELP